VEITYGATVITGEVRANKSDALAKIVYALKSTLEGPYDYYGPLTEVTISITIGEQS
jgi:hypothetical protein